MSNPNFQCSVFYSGCFHSFISFSCYLYIIIYSIISGKAYGAVSITHDHWVLPSLPEEQFPDIVLPIFDEKNKELWWCEYSFFSTNLQSLQNTLNINFINLVVDKLNFLGFFNFPHFSAFFLNFIFKISSFWRFPVDWRLIYFNSYYHF